MDDLATVEERRKANSAAIEAADELFFKYNDGQRRVALSVEKEDALYLVETGVYDQNELSIAQDGCIYLNESL
jgi:hypothetical protein